MSVGILTVKLIIPENHSLKGKRQAIKPMITRIRNQFNVSVAELEDQDLWQVATIGICTISSHSQQVDRVLGQVVEFITQGRWDAELADYQIEILPGP